MPVIVNVFCSVIDNLLLNYVIDLPIPQPPFFQFHHLHILPHHNDHHRAYTWIQKY